MNASDDGMNNSAAVTSQESYRLSSKINVSAGPYEVSTSTGIQNMVLLIAGMERGNNQIKIGCSLKRFFTASVCM